MKGKKIFVAWDRSINVVRKINNYESMAIIQYLKKVGRGARAASPLCSRLRLPLPVLPPAGVYSSRFAAFLLLEHYSRSLALSSDSLEGRRTQPFTAALATCNLYYTLHRHRFQTSQ
jgi:hypothetical protein